MGKYLCVFLLCFVSIVSEAQFSIMTGANFNKVRSSYLKNDRGALGFHAGLSLAYHPFKNSRVVSFEHELLFNYKGYKQDLDKIYEVNYGYITGSFLVKVKTGKIIHLRSGLEAGEMIYASVEDRYDKFNKTDVGIVLGASFFESNPFNFYIRGSLGLLPMLDYWDIDKQGAFHGEIHDIRNSTISIGVKYNFFNL